MSTPNVVPSTICQVFESRMPIYSNIFYQC